MRRNLLLAIVLTLGIVIGVTGSQLLGAQAVPLKPTDLLKADAAGMPGIEIIVTQVEFAPGATTGKHSHPGQEVTYVLEGSGVLEMEGEAPAVIKTGAVTYIPARKVHESKNGSATAPMKVLVFRIHPKGQPVTDRITEPSIMK
ncbi:MAG: cupin domain-containing protein, partial [Burkholderiales bacterium]